MTYFSTLKVGVKLVGSFLMVALIIAVVAAVGYVNMGTINAGVGALYAGRLAGLCPPRAVRLSSRGLKTGDSAVRPEVFGHQKPKRRWGILPASRFERGPERARH